MPVREHGVPRDVERVSGQLELLSPHSAEHVVVLGAPAKKRVGKSVHKQKMLFLYGGGTAEDG